MNQLYQSITKKNVGVYSVRVFCDSKGPVFGDADAFEVLQNIIPGSTPDQILVACKAVADVGKIEITNASGQGVVWYKDV